MTIDFHGVSRRYANGRGVADLQISFLHGLTTAVVGKSGSGKSTLLKLVNGLEIPQEGNVSVLGTPIDYQQLTAHRRRIGYAVQGAGLFPHLTAADNVALLAKFERWEKPAIDARLCELFALVELSPDFMAAYPHELSGGEQQRVGLARALMLDPPILLLDEPFGALDPITRHELHRECLRLQAYKPRTIILVTHDVREAVKLADRIVVMHDARIVQEGSRDEVVQRPVNDFVKAFFEIQLQ